MSSSLASIWRTNFRCASIRGRLTTALSRDGTPGTAGVASMRLLWNRRMSSAQSLIVQPIVNAPGVSPAGIVLAHHSTVIGPWTVVGPGLDDPPSGGAGQPSGSVSRHQTQFGSYGLRSLTPLTSGLTGPKFAPVGIGERAPGRRNGPQPTTKTSVSPFPEHPTSPGSPASWLLPWR